VETEVDTTEVDITGVDTTEEVTTEGDIAIIIINHPQNIRASMAIETLVTSLVAEVTVTKEAGGQVIAEVVTEVEGLVTTRAEVRDMLLPLYVVYR